MRNSLIQAYLPLVIWVKLGLEDALYRSVWLVILVALMLMGLQLSQMQGRSDP